MDDLLRHDRKHDSNLLPVIHLSQDNTPNEHKDAILAICFTHTYYRCNHTVRSHTDDELHVVTAWTYLTEFRGVPGAPTRRHRRSRESRILQPPIPPLRRPVPFQPIPCPDRINPIDPAPTLSAHMLRIRLLQLAQRIQTTRAWDPLKSFK